MGDRNPLVGNCVRAGMALPIAFFLQIRSMTGSGPTSGRR